MLHSQLDEVSALPYTLVAELPPGHCVSVMGASSALVFPVYLLLLKPLLLTKMTHDGGKVLPSFCPGEACGSHHGHSKEESSQHQQPGHKAAKILQEFRGCWDKALKG